MQARFEGKKKENRFQCEKNSTIQQEGYQVIRREVLCVSCDVYEANFCRVNTIIIVFRFLIHLETFPMLQV